VPDQSHCTWTAKTKVWALKEIARLRKLASKGLGDWQEIQVASGKDKTRRGSGKRGGRNNKAPEASASMSPCFSSAAQTALLVIQKDKPWPNVV
jgi:hypothetical protein